MTNATLNVGPLEGPLSHYVDERTSRAKVKAHLFGPAALAALKHANFQSSAGSKCQCSGLKYLLKLIKSLERIECCRDDKLAL